MMAQRILVDNCLNDATVAIELARYGYADTLALARVAFKADPDAQRGAAVERRP